MRFVLILVTMVFSTLGVAQQPGWIVWQSEVLNWSDFKANPENLEHFDAMTEAGIFYTMDYYQEEKDLIINFDVMSFFNGQNSWVKSNHKKSHLLKHEQVHFDIAEVHCRMLRQTISEYPFTINFKSEALKLYKENEAKRQKMQKLYDQDTRHGQNVKEQEKWNQKVDRLLRKYNKWNKRMVPTKNALSY